MLGYGKNSYIELKSKSNGKRTCRSCIINVGCSDVNGDRYVFEQISLTGGIPFAVTLPKAPDSLNVDQMTDEEFHVKLQKGYDDIKAGRVQDAASAFAKFRENH